MPDQNEINKLINSYIGFQSGNASDGARQEKGPAPAPKLTKIKKDIPVLDATFDYTVGSSGTATVKKTLPGETFLWTIEGGNITTDPTLRTISYNNGGGIGTWTVITCTVSRTMAGGTLTDTKSVSFIGSSIAPHPQGGGGGA